jgi:hypothetical protein
LPGAVNFLSAIIGVIPEEFETSLTQNIKKLSKIQEIYDKSATACAIVKNKDDIESFFLTIDLLNGWIGTWSGPYVSVLVNAARAQVEMIREVGKIKDSYILPLADQVKMKIRINETTHCWMGGVFCNNPIADNKISNEIRSWSLLGQTSSGSYSLLTDIDVDSRKAISYSPVTYSSPGRPAIMIRIIFKNGQRFSVPADPNYVSFKREFSVFDGDVVTITMPNFEKNKGVYSYE